MKFSANLGFLWNDLPIDLAIQNAAETGFHAVETHWPYEVEPSVVSAALDESGLDMVCINTRPGSLSDGEFGLAALPERRDQAIENIEEAVSFAQKVGSQNVHVMAGKADINTRTFEVFCKNLEYATQLASKFGITILIEPINPKDVPGYFLTSLEEAKRIYEEIKSPHLKIMFDCYHIEIIHGNLIEKFRQNSDRIGHIQFASVPSRNEPQFGDLDYPHIFREIISLGWSGYFGAEYRPKSDIYDGLSWLNTLVVR